MLEKLYSKQEVCLPFAILSGRNTCVGRQESMKYKQRKSARGKDKRDTTQEEVRRCEEELLKEGKGCHAGTRAWTRWSVPERSVTSNELWRKDPSQI